MSELTRTPEEGWPADSTGSIFLGRVVDQLSDDELWSALCSGKLEARIYCVGRTDFGPIPLSPLGFLSADRDQVLGRYQIDVRETDRRRPITIRRAIPVPHWLFVTRASLDKFMEAKPAATAGAEDRAAKHLAGVLKMDPDMKRQDALHECRKFNLTNRGFQNRVWPKARQLAKLPPARAGAKSKRKSTR
jgi:hypothetical protein